MVPAEFDPYYQWLGIPPKQSCARVSRPRTSPDRRSPESPPHRFQRVGETDRETQAHPLPTMNLPKAAPADSRAVEPPQAEPDDEPIDFVEDRQATYSSFGSHDASMSIESTSCMV